MEVNRHFGFKTRAERVNSDPYEDTCTVKYNDDWKGMPKFLK